MPPISRAGSSSPAWSTTSARSCASSASRNGPSSATRSRWAAAGRPKIVYSNLFGDNPDGQVPEYQTENGVYEPGCGLDRVHMSWGHDEYVYHVVKDHLPEEALYMLRYHSFYPWHKEGEYTHLTNDTDRSMLKWVRAFNRYDLYSKGSPRPDVPALMPYYQELVEEFFPQPLRW